MKVKLGTFVHIYWLDSNYVRGWHPREDVTGELPVVESAGWVTMCTPDILEVAGTRVAGGSSKLNPLAIPQKSVLKVKKVKI